MHINACLRHWQPNHFKLFGGQCAWQRLHCRGGLARQQRERTRVWLKSSAVFIPIGALKTTLFTLMLLKALQPLQQIRITVGQLQRKQTGLPLHAACFKITNGQRYRTRRFFNHAKVG